MVEPPVEFLGRRILEVNDGVLVAVEHLFVKERAGAVQERRVINVRAIVDLRAVEAREDRRRRHPVEAVAVIKQT
jgi:hypothetical protein